MNGIYMVITKDLQQDLELAFTEIEKFFQDIIIQGLSNIAEEQLKELEEFIVRLNALGAENLASYLQQFITLYQDTSSKKDKTFIKQAIEYIIRILTYIRVFDRSMTFEVVAQQLTTILEGPSRVVEDKLASKE